MLASAVGEWLRTILGPVILIFLGILLFKLVSELIRLSRDEDFPAFESNWGGLGRGLGGWSVNRMMVIGVLALLALLLFGSFSYLLLSNRSGGPRSEASKMSEGSAETSKSTGTTAANPTPAKAADTTPSGSNADTPKRKE
jgi:hypothetical protein